jgi:hypothetical protein
MAVDDRERGGGDRGVPRTVRPEDLAVGRAGGATDHVYDVQAHMPRPTPERAARLQRLFAGLRYDRYSFLADEAVRKRDCSQARRLASSVLRTIDQLRDKSPEQRERLRFVLRFRLRACLGQAAGSGLPAASEAPDAR